MMDLLVTVQFILTVAATAVIATMRRSLFLDHEMCAEIGNLYARSIHSK